MDAPSLLRLAGWIAILPGFAALGLSLVSSRFGGALAQWCVQNWWWLFFPGAYLYLLLRAFAQALEGLRRN